MIKIYYPQKKSLLLLILLLLCFSIDACKCNNPHLIEPKAEEEDPTQKKGEPSMIIKIVRLGDQELIGDGALIRFKLIKDTTLPVEQDKLQLKITTTVTPTGKEKDMTIMLSLVSLTNAELPKNAIAFDKDIILTIKENTKDTITKAKIVLKLLYDGKPLENQDSEQTFEWEPINSVAEELFEAIDKWNIKDVKKILDSPDKKAKLRADAMNKNKDSFLCAAANRGIPTGYCELLEALFTIPGLDVNKQVSSGNQTNFLENQLHNNNVGLNVICCLLDNGAQVAFGTTGIHECLRYFKWNDSDCDTGMIQKLDWFLDTVVPSNPTLINTQDRDGNTPLHLAVGHITNNNGKIFQRLISAGAKLDIPNNANKSPRDLANATMLDFTKNNITAKSQPLYQAFENAFKHA